MTHKSLKPNSARSPLADALVMQQNLLRWNELGPEFFSARLSEDTEFVWAQLPQKDGKVRERLERSLATQYLVGYMEGLAAIRRARDTQERWKKHIRYPEKDNPVRKILPLVSGTPTIEAFLEAHGDKVIPSDIKSWAWLQELRKRQPKPTWNDAASKDFAKTRKAFQVQFRRLQEHVLEKDLAEKFLKNVISLTQQRKSKLGVLKRTTKPKR